jgi:hypothetical protein
VSALLATTYRYDGEHRITPDDMAWATTHGGRLRVIEHDDGSVTFTKAHRDECPFITSAGTQDCDDECALTWPHPHGQPCPPPGCRGKTHPAPTSRQHP